MAETRKPFETSMMNLKHALMEARHEKVIREAGKVTIERRAKKMETHLEKVAHKLNDVFSTYRMDRLIAKTKKVAFSVHPKDEHFLQGEFSSSDFKSHYDNGIQSYIWPINFTSLVVQDIHDSENLGTLYEEPFLTNCEASAISDEVFENYQAAFDKYLSFEKTEIEAIIAEVTKKLQEYNK